MRRLLTLSPGTPSGGEGGYVTLQSQAVPVIPPLRERCITFFSFLCSPYRVTIISYCLHRCRAWLLLLWQWLSRQPSGALRACLDLPILPVQGQGLLPLPDKSLASTVVLQLPSQSQQRDLGLVAVLEALGLHVLDAAFPLPVRELLLHHAHPLSGPGVLEALSAQQQQQRLGGGKKGEASPGHMLLHERLQALSSSERRCLRLALLSEDCLLALKGGQSQKLLALLRSLPIFESAVTPRSQAAIAEAEGGSHEERQPGAAAFVDLTGLCYLEPAGFDAAPLLACYQGQPGQAAISAAPKFARTMDGELAEGRLMVQCLGVKAVTGSEMFKQVRVAALSNRGINMAGGTHSVIPIPTPHALFMLPLATAAPAFPGPGCTEPRSEGCGGAGAPGAAAGSPQA